MAAHLPPSLRGLFSPAVVRDLEQWMLDVIEGEVRRRVEEAAVSPWMTPDEAAAWLGCNRRRIYDLCHQRRLARHHDDGRLLLRRADVEALVQPEDGHDW